jgi:hypothetical protein
MSTYETRTRDVARLVAWRVFDAASLPDDDRSLTIDERRAITVPERCTARRVEWVRGRAALHRTFRAIARDSTGVSFVSSFDGAPLVIGRPGWSASLSHDGDHFAAAVGQIPVGIDVCARSMADRAAAVTARLRRRFLRAPREVDPICLWAVLEAALKVRRDSITSLLWKSIAVRNDGPTHVVVDGLGQSIRVRLFEAGRYALAVAVSTPDGGAGCLY